MFFQPRYVAKSNSDFIVNLGQAFFFVLVVMLAFAGWRLAVIVGVLAIPGVAVVGALAGVARGLNRPALAVGLDAVVVPLGTLPMVLLAGDSVAFPFPHLTLPTISSVLLFLAPRPLNKPHVLVGQ